MNYKSFMVNFLKGLFFTLQTFLLSMNLEEGQMTRFFNSLLVTQGNVLRLMLVPDIDGRAQGLKTKKLNID